MAIGGLIYTVYIQLVEGCGTDRLGPFLSADDNGAIGGIDFTSQVVITVLRPIELFDQVFNLTHLCGKNTPPMTALSSAEVFPFLSSNDSIACRGAAGSSYLENTIITTIYAEKSSADDSAVIGGHFCMFTV